MSEQAPAFRLRARHAGLRAAEFARKRARPILVAAAAMVLLLTVWRVTVAAPREAQLGLASGGAWLTLGDDLRHGEFYRPIVSPLGYGGTRYFPLQIALLGGLMKLGLPPIAAGFIWTFASAAALIGGAAAFLRRLGAPAWFALSVGVLCLAPRPVQDAVVAIRGDLLPAALSLWGLAFCVSSPEENRPTRTVAASAFFALAFAAKVTSIFGAAASVIWLLVNGRRRQALQLALLAAGLAAVLIGAAQWASQGRFLEQIVACGSAGGGWRRALQAPGEMLHHFSDPVCMLFLLLACVVLWAGGRAWARELPAITLAVTALGTLLLLTSPGTSLNQMLDLFVMLPVVAAAGVALRRASIVWGGVGLAAVCLLAAADRTASKFSADRLDQAAVYRRVLQVAGKGEAPLLAEDPMLPLAAGERPVVLDSWMLAVLMKDRPGLAADLRDRVARRAFRALVLDSPETERRRASGAGPTFGGVVQEALDGRYEQAATIGGYRIYLPCPSPAAPPAPPTTAPRP